MPPGMMLDEGGVAPQPAWLRRPNALSGSELARLFGDRTTFQLAAPRVSRGRENTVKDTMWVGVHFGTISRGSTIFAAPDLDCHVTLTSVVASKVAGPKLVALGRRIEELQKRIDKVKPEALQGSAVVCELFGEEDYRWADILVHSRLHATLCCWASHLCKDFVPFKDFWGKAAFHISFATATEWRA